MHLKKILFVSLILLSQTTFAIGKKDLHWKIENKGWSADYEKLYQQFIHGLGAARKKGLCKTTDGCLKNQTANPLYFHLNPAGLTKVFSDCADLPFVLRAYFSWMNNLPFSYPDDLVAAKSLSRAKIDIRYSRYGNIITSKHIVKNGENINRLFQQMVDSISTASFRTNASLNDTGNLFRDTYPVDIDSRAIVPGTLLYDPNGHVAIVYEVTSNGKILLLDAHPDNSLSVITYGEKFARSGIKVGAGFSNFRPYSMKANKILPLSNSELTTYSLIQFQPGPFFYKGKAMGFYEYVRNKMSDGDIVYDPLTEFSDQLDEICQDIKNREEAVNISLQSKIQDLAHPRALPPNIYGADGEWEAYATPARDARLKTSFKQTKDFLTKMIAGFMGRELKMIYNGDDLVTDLRDIYLKKSSECKVNVTATLSQNLDNVLFRLFALSFDPYHCAELRWGIIDRCRTTANKIKWYHAEQGLRNRIDRDTSIRTDYDVETLPSAPASQVQMPDFSFDRLLEIERFVFSNN